MSGQTPEEAERERDEDERNVGCFLQLVDRATYGCMLAAIPIVVAFTFLLS